MNVSLSALRRALLENRRPLHRRLTLLSTLAVAVTLVAVCVTGWVALRITLFDINERGSVLIAQDLTAFARSDIRTTGRLSALVLGPGSTVVEAVGADGTVLLTPGEDTVLDLGSPEVVAAQQQEQSIRNTVSSSGERYRVVTEPLADTGYVLVVGRPLTAAAEVLNVFRLVVLSVGGIGLVLAWLLGRAVATAALRPVQRFTDAVRHVAETEDLRPVSAGYAHGIIPTLTDTFNQMLARLASSRDQQDRLVADASHELRTPLTSMRTNLELLAMDSRSGRLNGAVRAKIVDDVLAQTVELGALVNDLVHLTRDTTPTREQVDLRAVVQAAVEHARLRGPGLDFAVELGPLDVLGDAAGLEQAARNILDNAVKWSPPGGTIHVYREGGRLHVVDEGPGIADADLPHVFDRFYRAEAARSTPGTGLGLAVAAKAVHDHGGSIRVESPPGGGAHFTIQLPGTSTPMRPAPTQTATSRPLPEAATIAS
jgi:two-component system, OmpR family, sensor histidine kinase MprB